MQDIKLSGTYYEMGKEYGKELKKKGFRPPVKTEKEKKLGEECKEIVETVFPEILEEIRGISDSSGLDYTALTDHILLYPFISRAPGCTSFSINMEGETWVGRNYDMFYRLKKDLESYLTTPMKGYTSLAQTDMMVGREDGINEKGLYAALHGVPSIFVPGVHFWISIRYILDKCRNVEEAVRYLEETQAHCAFKVMLADKSGKMAVAEIHPEKMRVRWPEDNYIVTTNHLDHPDMKEYTMFEPPDSRPRYNKCLKELEKIQRIEVETLQSILSGHEGLVCSHLDQYGVGTIYSTVTNVNNLKVWKAVGHPCRNSYVKDTRLDNYI